MPTYAHGESHAMGGPDSLEEHYPCLVDGAIELDALPAHTHAQADITGLAATLAGKADGGHPSIPDLSAGTLTVLGDVIAAHGDTEATVNSILAALRAAGLIETGS